MATASVGVIYSNTTAHGTAWAEITELQQDPANNRTRFRIKMGLNDANGYSPYSSCGGMWIRTYRSDGTELARAEFGSYNSPQEFYSYDYHWIGHDSSGRLDLQIYVRTYFDRSSDCNRYDISSGNTASIIIDYDRTPNAPATPSLSRSNNGTNIYMSTSTTIKNSGPNVNQFDWYYSTDNVNFNFLSTQSPSSTNASAWTWTGATSAQTYWFKAYAHNTDEGDPAGNSTGHNGTGKGWSAAGGVGGIYGAPTPPGKPVGTTDTTTAGKINITWPHSSSNLQVSQYDIYRDGTTLIGSTTGNWAANSISDTGQTRGTTHTYQVYGYNSSGWSYVSATSDAVMAPGIPSAPATPTVTSKIGRTLTLHSNRGSSGYNNAISEYRIQLSTDNGATWKGWDNTSKSFTATNTYNVLDSSGNFVYTLLTPALTYKWRVFAVNSIGTGDIATMSSGTFVSSGGKRYTGTVWQPTEIAKRYNGSTWVDITIAKKFDGTSWVDLT